MNLKYFAILGLVFLGVGQTQAGTLNCTRLINLSLHNYDVQVAINSQLKPLITATTDKIEFELATPEMAERISIAVQDSGATMAYFKPEELKEIRALAKAARIIADAHPGISPAQRKVISRIEYNELLTLREIEDAFGLATNRLSLVQGLLKWFISPEQVALRDFNKSLRGVFWRSFTDFKYEYSAVSRAEVETIYEYYREHGSLKNAPLSERVIENILFKNKNADTQNSNFVIAGSELKSSILPEFLENPRFLERVLEGIKSKDEARAKIVSAEVLRFLYYLPLSPQRGSIAFQLLQIVARNQPNVTAVVVTYENHRPYSTKLEEVLSRLKLSLQDLRD